MKSTKTDTNMTQKLFPETEIFQKDRPLNITSKQHNDYCQEVAAEIIKNKWSTSDSEDIILDIEDISCYDEGYDIAKKLERSRNANYKINTNFIEFLDGFNHYKDEIHKKNIKEWVTAHNPQPKFNLGAMLFIEKEFMHDYRKGEVVYVTGFSKDLACYLIQKDPNYKGGFVVAYEKVESSCILEENSKEYFDHKDAVIKYVDEVFINSQKNGTPLSNRQFEFILNAMISLRKALLNDSEAQIKAAALDFYRNNSVYVTAAQRRQELKTLTVNGDIPEGGQNQQKANMKTNSRIIIYFAVMEIASSRFVSKVTKRSGKVFFVKNPFNANYFLQYGDCANWLTENNLSNDEYLVMKFQ